MKIQNLLLLLALVPAIEGCGPAYSAKDGRQDPDADLSAILLTDLGEGAPVPRDLNDPSDPTRTTGPIAQAGQQPQAVLQNGDTPTVIQASSAPDAVLQQPEQPVATSQLPQLQLAIKPECKLSSGSCGFNYSSGYPNGGKTCRITYRAPGSAATSSKIFYTNCGTCRQAVLRDGLPTSYEGAIYASSNLRCFGQVGLDLEYGSAHSFKVETLSSSSCAFKAEYFAYPKGYCLQ